MNQIQSITTPSGRLLTVLEAMAVLRVGRTKLYQLIGNGHLEVIHFGQRSTRIKTESIEKLLTHGIAV
ncbi:MAG: helix-turn-helix domain-containing protein [Betaproteobacteria bacterium]|nr:helix-turn-helix domain-containing protein [Betaproteobacteria bacterium]MBK8318361.1 helix-turn-helix domain-containing protein [Betaproteobacteria bacterium]MBK9783390.1 helix-turn-helix domain-containing protein [Candidatus Dechloromonas phosphorivorans]